MERARAARFIWRYHVLYNDTQLDANTVHESHYIQAPWIDSPSLISDLVNPSDLVVKEDMDFIPSTGGLVWITGSGNIAKNLDVQRTVRRHVMIRHYQDKKQRKAAYLERKPVSVARSKLVQGSLQLRELESSHLRVSTKPTEYQELVPYSSSPSAQTREPKLYCSLCAGSSATKEGFDIEGCRCQRLLHKDCISESPTMQRDPFFQYPIDVTAQDIKLIEYILDDNNMNRVAHRHETLANAISDPIAFHQMLSTFALWMVFKLKYTGGASYLNHDAIIHHNKAIKAVSQRLHDGIGITGEGMIAAVLGFAHHAHVRLDFSAWKSHMDGVKQIVKLRGGVQTLNQDMKNTLYWHDLGGAYTQVTPLLFDWSTDTISNLILLRPPARSSSSAFERVAKVWLNRFPSQQEFLGLLESLSLIATHLNEQFILTGCPADETFPLRCIIKPMIYRFLNFNTMIERKDEASVSSYAILESSRLASLLFLAPLRRHFGVFPVFTTFQVAKLRRLLTENNDLDWHGLETLQFWILTLAYLESSGDKMWWEGARDNFGSRFSLENQLPEFIWINALHGSQLSILNDHL
ncbi:hypothetical protein GLAREA_07183 [Glarea lozoyensis ATCC 20868]|uniref:Uncharacterized protein n=1 Tax=Glarea lozoyensis (strain ATCC 20868 / MF5171) TaxID=1116229 RepID=S3D8X1_GLAL2|nr:uncharacterized protein GLAREA_07183 [Glarea lozoyensis ATCC 20868]EPE34170.1 hypothetical protein GLAREA_07183 [Glarea lozoyensis ATCC 20868]